MIRSQLNIAVILLFMTLLAFQSKAQNHSGDSLAAVAIYNALDGPNWVNNDGWLSAPLDQWYGVYVNQDGRINKLELYQNDLSGIIPPEIGQLESLRDLSLANNNITGAIPDEISGCQELEEFNIFVNDVEDLGNGLGQCPSLIHIIAYKNAIKSIPDNFSNQTGLWRLELGSNELTGQVPAFVSDLTKLRTLDLSKNNLTGQMPSLKNLTELDNLYISGNQLEGQLSDFIPEGSKIRYISVGFNFFEGHVSESLFPPDMFNFLLDGNQFTSLGDFSSFMELDRVWLGTNALNMSDILQFEETPLIQFYYSPQASVGEEEFHMVDRDGSITITSGIDGVGTQYQWYKDNQMLTGANDRSLTIDNFGTQNEGDYHCEGKHDSLPDLTLTTEIYHLELSSTSNKNLSPDSWTIYNNPGRVINIETSINGDIEVYNQQGVLIESIICSEGSQVLISDLRAGLYYLKLTQKHTGHSITQPVRVY